MTQVFLYGNNQFRTDGFGEILWIDIVNSEHFDGFGNLTDHLQEAEWIKALWDHYQLGPEVPMPTPQSIYDLRVWLRHVAHGLHTENTLSPQDFLQLNQLLTYPVTRQVELTAAGEPEIHFKSTRSGWEWLQAEAAYSLAQMLGPKQTRRIKICPNTGCNWLFFDKTKGNNRKWCNDMTCGNRDKVRRFRSKRK